jgi:hypothetical protein
MRRLLFFVLVLAVVGISTQALIAAPKAQAVGETVGCIVSPTLNTTYNNNCRSTKPSTSYTAKFKVFHGAGTYSFNWHWDWSGAASSPPTTAYGCTSSTDYCWVRVPSDNCGDKTVIATVSIILNGRDEGVLNSSAHVFATCWLGTMLTWC